MSAMSRSSIVTIPFLLLALLFAVPTGMLGAARDPVRAREGMVVSVSPEASAAGVEVLKKGGNAVDAAVAVALALAVTWPSAGNLGGGGFMLIRFKDGKTVAIDYREMAPAAATRDIFVDAQGNLIRGEGGSTVGYRASG